MTNSVYRMMRPLWCAFIPATLMLMTACAEDDGPARTKNGEGIVFAPETVSDWNATRGDKYIGVDREGGGKTFANNESFHVSGYRYAEESTVGSVTAANFYNNVTVSRNAGGEWRPVDQQYYVPLATDKIDFFAWFTPTGSTGITPVDAVGGLQLQYTVPANISQQPDLLTAVTKEQTYSSAANTAVPLSFEHQLTAVNFVLAGNVAPGTITEIAFLNVYTTATLSIGSGTWNYTTAPTETTYALNFSTTDDLGALRSGETILENLMMIPQTFTSDNQQIRITMTVDNQERILYANLKPAQQGDPDRWVKGTTVTYVVSTSAVNVLHLNTVTYPTAWSATPFKSEYAEGDELGIFAVNAEGNVVYANKKFTMNNVGQWVCDDVTTTLFVPGCTYYAYYPWQSALTDAPAVNDNVLVASALPTAAQFFADAVTAWEPSVDQSSLTKLNNADLQIGRSTETTASTVNFTMAHTMGLASITMGSMSVANVAYFNTNNEIDSRTQATTGVITSNNFTGNLPFELSSGKHFFVVKPSTNYEFTATPQGALDAWSGIVTANVAAGGYADYTAPSKFITRNYIYRGWVYSASEAPYTFDPPALGTYTFECWGSEGQNRSHLDPGRGAYTKGDLTMTNSYKGPFFIFVGAGGTNGGGAGEQRGGGATDIRLANTQDFAGWKSRIMVAAGGGGAFYSGGGSSSAIFTNRQRGDAGAYNGYDAYGQYPSNPSTHYSGYGASQTAGGARGQGTSEIDADASFAHGSFWAGGYGYDPHGGTPSSGGGGGYYGGGHGVHPGSSHSGGGGGSSFISGHTGFNAVGANATANNRQHTNSPNHYSNYIFNEGTTEVIDGRGYKWTDTSTKTLTTTPAHTSYSSVAGHTGDGYCRITSKVIE